MMTAKLFENGRSQAVRLPKECRYRGEEVAVNKIGDIEILMTGFYGQRPRGECLPGAGGILRVNFAKRA